MIAFLLVGIQLIIELFQQYDRCLLHSRIFLNLQTVDFLHVFYVDILAK